jgi:hypothetical protein
MIELAEWITEGRDLPSQRLFQLIFTLSHFASNVV